MKQCSACKSIYTDDSLKFCLNDGAALSAPSTAGDVTRQMTFDSNPTVENRSPIRVDIQSEIPNQNSFPGNTTQTTERKKSKSLAIIALISLLAIIGIASIVFTYFAFVKKDTMANVADNSLQDSNTNETQAIKDELEKLKKKVEDQKNTKGQTLNSNNTVIKPTPSQKGVVTATVNSPGDGFLSLRTEPNVKTGTQLVKIPTGATVQVEDCQQSYMMVDSRRGRWCMVSYDGKIGWVFDAWLNY